MEECRAFSRIRFGGVVDPVTMGAVLLAVATGVSEALGGQLWAGVVSLVRRPFHGRKEPAGQLPAAGSGETELTALQRSPGDQTKAVALAELLLARANGDPGFEQALQEWWEQAAPVREKTGNVTNTISGGVQHGPVLQGRDFTGLTFGASPAPPAQPKDPAGDLVTSEGTGEVSNTVGGGAQYGPVLQGGQFNNTTFVTHQAVAAPVALAQLPPLVTGFTGREAELVQVAGLLDPAGGTAAVVVSAVAGLAGVGKTALTVHAAHAARVSGWFPGGVLFIDLHGYDQNPVQPAQALDALLRALGVPGEHIPDGAEQRAGLYRSALAQVTGPLLVIADNASAEAQVRPLIPGPGPHRVIITSRHTLARLGARLLDVTVLDEAEAIALLDTVVRTARPDDDRIGGDPAAAGRLAGVCGGLPLALQITAAVLGADQALAAAELADQMTDEVGRLETLRYDDGSGVSAPSVAAAFELSYRQLDEDAAWMFRLLPACPGPDVSTGAAAELAGWPADRARAAIGRLARAHLVEPGGRARWRMHDLLRLYARQVPGASPGEREQGVGRLLAWYLRQARAADKHLRALAGTPVPLEFTGRGDALAWLDAERPGLIAAATMAAGTGRNQEAMTLPLPLREYLRWRRRFDDLLAILPISRDSARQLNHKVNEATALTSLGNALREVRRFEEAISAHQDAAAIFRETGDRHREGMTLNNLGGALVEVRRFEEAITCYEQDIAICRETGDRHGEGQTLDNLGGAYQEMGQPARAAECWRQAAVAMREADDQEEASRLEQLAANT